MIVHAYDNLHVHFEKVDRRKDIRYARMHTKSPHVVPFTVKTFGLLQPYFGHLSCMSVVCLTHYKTPKGCFLFESKLKCS